jgi:hypothetical protein
MSKAARAIWIGVGALAVAVGVAAVRGQDVRLTAPVIVPFEFVTNHIVVPVRVNGSRQLSFIFDTGDKDAIIDAARARELNLTAGRDVNVTGAGAGSLHAFGVSDARFTVDTLRGFSQPVVLAVPLDRLPPRLGHDVDGILGTEFIDAFVVEIDYRQRRLVLHDRRTFLPPAGGTIVPLQFDAHAHPVVDGAVVYKGERFTGQFVVDLGSSSALVLHSPFVAAHPAPSGAQTLVGSSGAAGETHGLIGRVSALKIGDFTLADPPAVFASDASGTFARADVLGTIGERAMSRFRIFLDYGRRQMILEAVEPLDGLAAQASCGCAIHAEGPDYHTFRVDAIAEGSAAFAAGLQAGDIIAAVDGRGAGEMTLSELLPLFDVSVERRLEIDRSGSRVTIALTPRRIP